MEQISTTSEENAGAAEQSLSAVNQITATTRNIITNAKDGIKKTTESVNSTIIAVKNSANSAKRMLNVAETTKDISLKSKDLKQASQNVGEAVNIIAKVADQTNLLALNAAIEAAKAKEHGKGFAVVADETRGLAVNSAQNAEETKVVVTKIQNSIDKIEVNVDDVQTIVQKSAEKISNSSNKGTELIEISNNAVNLTTAINEELSILLTNVEEMQKGSEGVASAAEEQASAVNQATNSIEMQASALSQAEEAANRLSEIAEELKNSTDVGKDAEEIASGAEELSSVVEEISRSMSEITGALDQIERAATLATDDASENTKTTGKCVVIVDNVNKEFEQIKKYLSTIIEGLESVLVEIKDVSKLTYDSIEKSKTTTDELVVVEKDSQNVTKILRKIENIIIQTTMLAVSGSIEAARAGEFGKGFAVVSSDVRSLAQDAGANTEKISEILNIFDNAVLNIVKNWQNMVDGQNSENIQLSTLLDQMENVTKNIKEVEKVINELYNSNIENKEALEQVLQGSEQIQQAAELSQNNTQESKQASELIISAINEMGTLVEELAVLADDLQQN
jgi:methyl-accepting chemotaxis protein